MISVEGGGGNGDFNYDGVVNADDYFLIDSAYIGQSGVLASGTPVEKATASTDELAMAVQSQQRKDPRGTLLMELFSAEPIL
jgi:hypothetical protein